MKVYIVIYRSKWSSDERDGEIQGVFSSESKAEGFINVQPYKLEPYDWKDRLFIEDYGIDGQL